MVRPPNLTLLRWGVAAALLVAGVTWLPRLDRQAEAATVMALLDRAVPGLEGEMAAAAPVEVVLVARGAAAPHAARIAERLAASPAVRPGPSGAPLEVALDLAVEPPALELTYAPPGGAPVRARAERAWVASWSVLPPLVAIVLAFATGRLVLSLLVSILLGGLLAVGPNPLAFFAHSVDAYFWKATVTDPFKLWIVVFTCALIGLVQLATRAGGVHGIVDRIAALARSARSTQLATALLGTAIFFDDYANTLLVGGTMRPLSDRMRISREKLAYIVDSTSAPVAGVAVISTWIGYEVGLFGDLARSLGLPQDGYQLFFLALPYRFYCWFTLLFLFMLLATGRDFGPMARAERRAWADGEVIRPGSMPLASRTFAFVAPYPGVPRMAHVALVPIAVVVGGTLFGLLWDGGGVAQVAARPAALFSFATWRDAFGAAANSTLVLAATSLAGSALAFGLVLGRGLLPAREAVRAYGRGIASMYIAIVILVLAWGIKAVADDLGTSYFLVAGLKDVVHPGLLPMIVFLLAAVVAFSTGTSWGTMGILIPTAVPLAYHVAGPVGMYVTMAAVLDGAIFGDHCSPLSDTTVMSSIAAGADHMDHVRTQVPYAVTTMLAAALFGYLWDAQGLPYGLGWAAALAGLAAVALVLGRRVRADTQAAEDGGAAAPHRPRVR